MTRLSTYTPERFPSFVRDNDLLIINFIKAYYESLQSPYYPLDLVDNLLHYYNVNNEYFKDLVEKTELVGISGNTINVKSTKGFPESGFVQIEDEIIYYTSKSETSLEGVFRGSKAIVRHNTTFVLKSSDEAVHSPGNEVYNIAYDFVLYYYSKLKYEVLNEFPDKLNKNLNLSTILKKIKDFYLVKGTPLADNLFFKILFNDQIIDIELEEFGSGAEFELVLNSGSITGVVIISGGSNYSNTVEIITNGNGNNAKFDVTVTDGIITQVSVLNGGSGYDSNSTLIAKNKTFALDELVSNQFTSIGKVVRSNENNISLYIIQNNFEYGQKIFSSNTEGIIKSFVAKEVEPTKLYPINHTIKLSDFDLLKYDFVSIKHETGEDYLEVLSRNNSITYKICDKAYTYYYDNIIRTINPFGEFVYNINLTKAVELAVSTKNRVLKVESDVVTLDSAAGFPTKNGYFLVNGYEYFYNIRSENQLFNVTAVNHSETIIIDSIAQFYAYDYSTQKIYNVFEIESERFLIEPKFNETVVIESGGGFSENLKLNLKDNRIDTLTAHKANWRINETSITKNSKDRDGVFCDISGVYTHKTDTYITFTEIPNRDLDFRALNANQQNSIKRIAANQIIVDSNSPNEGAIGVMLDGTQIQSYRGKQISYGKYENITITNTGVDYPLIENSGNVTHPYLDIAFPNGNHIYLEDQVKVFGVITDIDITNINPNDLNGFITKPTYTVTNASGDNGSGLVLDFKLEYTYENNIVKNIKIIGIIIINSGSNYTKKPTITISGGGKVSNFDIPKDNITIIGGIKFTDGSLSKNFNNIDLKSFYLASSTEPNTSLDSFERIINPTVEYGSGAEIAVFVVGGSINIVDIVDGGKNYITKPQIIVNGNGTGAILEPVLTNGVITDIIIVNSGTGYNFTPIIEVVTEGSGFTTNSEITKWTLNASEIITTDNYGGFVYDKTNTTHTMVFDENILVPRQTQPGYSQLTYNHNITNNTYWNNTTDSHSKLIGWAYDHTPIYSGYRANVYGLDNTILSTVPLESSYQLKLLAEDHRPSTISYPMGYFLEDYEFIGGSGDLDEYNGRFAVTPEYPEGKYCYFATNTFPYFVGLNHKYTVDPYNKSVYSSVDDLSDGVLKVHYNENYPYQKNTTGNSKLEVVNITSGSVDNILIESGGELYKLSDIVKVDNTNTNGSGLSCIIKKLVGKPIDSISYDSGLNKVTVNTTVAHELSTNDKVYIKEKIINNLITPQSTLTIDSIFENTQIIKYINYRFEIDSSYVDSGNQYYTIHLTQDNSAIKKLYFDNYIFKRRYIEINSSVLPNIFYIIITDSSGNIVKRVKVSLINFDLFGEKAITSESANSFSYIIDDSAEVFSSIFDIDEYTVTSSSDYTEAISDIEIISSGSGYKDTPLLSVESFTGSGAALNCYGDNIGKILLSKVVKNTDFCLGYKQDYYETLNYYSGKIKGNIELYDVLLSTPFFLDGFTPIVKIVGTDIILDTTFSNTGNYYFDITLNSSIFSLDSERDLEVLFQSLGSFNGTSDTFGLVDTSDILITSPTLANTFVFRNGVFQSESEYSYVDDNITFSPSNIPEVNESIFVLKFENSFELLNFSFSDNITTYHLDVSSNISDFTNAENRLLVFKEGVLQSKSLWTWDSVNEFIVFNEPVDTTFTNPYENIEIRLLANSYNFYTTVDSSLILSDQGNYTFTGADSVLANNVLFSYNSVVQEFEKGFNKDTTDFVGGTPQESFRIIVPESVEGEVFIYDLGTSVDYGILLGVTQVGNFDVVPLYRRSSIPENNLLYTSTNEEIIILESRNNGNVVVYSDSDIDLNNEELLYYADSSLYGTIYNIKKAKLGTTIDAKVPKSIINKKTKLSNKLSRLSSNYYNTFTSDVGFYRNPDEWLNYYKSLNKPVGSKPYATAIFESFSSINKLDRDSTILEII